MISVWSEGMADECMPEQMLVGTLALVRKHPWWHARSRLALAMLTQNGIAPPARIIEVGCGWGINLDALEQAGYDTTGLDISRQILTLIDRPTRRLVVADLMQGFPAREIHDGLLALDVIEHLDDDRGAVHRFAELLRPGGIAIVSVPALPELYSEFDRIQGHRRRYTPQMLTSLFDGSGLKLLAVSWWGAWMVPVLRGMRRERPQERSRTYQDYLRIPPWPIPLAMRLMYALEHRRALRRSLSTGTSLFAIARREGG